MKAKDVLRLLRGGRGKRVFSVSESFWGDRLRKIWKKWPFERRVRGEIRCERVWRDGRVDVLIDENVIMNKAREEMSNLIAGFGGGGNIVTSIAFAAGGHDPANPTVALPIDPAETGLNGSEIIRKTALVSKPSIYRTRFEVTLDYAEAIGPLSEAGLFMLTAGIFGKKTFGLITKSVEFKLIWKWTVVFAWFLVLVSPGAVGVASCVLRSLA